MSGPILLVLRFLLAACLYAFFAYGLWSLWQEMKRESRLSAARRPAPLLLTLLSEDPPQPRRFNTAEVTIGRDPVCSLILDDSTVSAKHARLFYRQGQWWAEDLRSTNGSFLNREPITAPLVLTNGDELSCGQARLAITIYAEPTLSSLNGGHLD